MELSVIEDLRKSISDSTLFKKLREPFQCLALFVGVNLAVKLTIQHRSDVLVNEKL